jgi:hypothetical protein
MKINVFFKSDLSLLIFSLSVFGTNTLQTEETILPADRRQYLKNLSKILDSSICGENNIPVHLASRHSKLFQLLISATDVTKPQCQTFCYKNKSFFSKSNSRKYPDESGAQKHSTTNSSEN